MGVGPSSLKCVTGWSERRPLRDLLETALRARVRAEEIRHLHGEVFLVYTEAGTAAIRDWLAPHLRADESVFVAEFERWSGHGPAPDRRWLMRRGH